jgi:hypothetical protein
MFVGKTEDWEMLLDLSVQSEPVTCAELRELSGRLGFPLTRNARYALQEGIAQYVEKDLCHS